MPSMPSLLSTGDRVAVIAPSSPFEAADLEKGLEWLRAQGYEPVSGAHLHGRYRYLAGSDEERAADFMAAVTDPSIAAIICARGGYGCGRMLAHLDACAIRPHCKFVVGFSDVTMLHLWLQSECGWITFHGPMVGTKWAGEGFDPETAGSLLGALRGQLSTVAAPQGKTVHGGQARGRLLGGNLSLLCASIGTHIEPDTDGAILLLEDVFEPPYRVDRMLTHLRQAGKLSGVRAVVMGQMVKCEAKDADYTINEVLEDCLCRLDVPIVLDFPISHGKPNYTVALGQEYTLDADARVLAPGDF